MLVRQARIGAGSSSASRTPTTEFNSSTSPMAAIRVESLPTREPSPRPVVPASPVLRDNLAESMAHAGRLKAIGQHTRCGRAGQAPGHAIRRAAQYDVGSARARRAAPSTCAAAFRHDPPPSLRDRSRPQRRQLHAADAAVADRARRVHLSRRARGRPRRPPLHVGGDLRALAAGSRRRWPAPGIGVGDTVAVMAANTPEMVEAHFGVPMTGAVLNTLNTRLDADAIAFMLEHGEAKVLITDTEFSPTIEQALARARREAAGDRHRRSAGPGRQARSAPPTTRPSSPAAIPGTHGRTRPTSGTRSRSTTRRARPAIRRASSITTAARTSTRCRTSSTGACRGTPSTCGRCRCSTATAGASRGRWPPTPASTSACARSRRRPSSTRSATHRVTHYCGAPIVHLTLINAPAELRAGIDHVVHCLVAGAAPPAAVIEGMERMGFDITHVYGLTETYGPAAVCAKHAGVGRARHRRAHRAQRPPGRALHGARRG